MSKLSLYPAFLKSLVLGKSNILFLMGVILGFSFSIAVILSTIGLMDGFEKSLRENLKGHEGDISIHSRDGFFPQNSVKDSFLELDISTVVHILLTEGFAMTDMNSKAVLIVGADSEEYSRLTEKNIFLRQNQIVIGKALAHELHLKVGDSLTIAFAQGNQDFHDLPALRPFTVKEIKEHPLYQKDQRFVLMDKTLLQDYLKAPDLINLVYLKIPETSPYLDEKEKIVHFLTRLDERLEGHFIARPYWHEFKTLLEAVKVEKFMIGIILQIIVVMAILNIVAFIIFINEKKSKELFLLKALGMSGATLAKAWYIFIFLIWLGSCIFSLIFVKIFDVFLRSDSLFKLPGEIYQMEKIELAFDFNSYMIVFGLAFLWLVFIGFFMLKKIRAKVILQGLRQEFG